MYASRQKGISLISLMVGTTISLFLAIAMLQLFKSVTKISTTAQQDAVNDSQITAALLASGFALQAAGFGIAQPTLGTDLELLGTASLQGTQLSGTAITVTEQFNTAQASDGFALAWRSLPSLGASTSQCHALYAPARNAGGNAPGYTAGLYLLQSQNGCPENLHNAQWRTVRTLADGVDFVLQASQQTCTPLGHTNGGKAPSTHLLVQISTRSSAGLALSEHYCLRNFVFDPA